MGIKWKSACKSLYLTSTLTLFGGVLPLIYKNVYKINTFTALLKSGIKYKNLRTLSAGNILQNCCQLFGHFKSSNITINIFTKGKVLRKFSVYIETFSIGSFMNESHIVRKIC